MKAKHLWQPLTDTLHVLEDWKWCLQIRVVVKSLSFSYLTTEMRLNDTAVLVIILSCWLQKSLFSLLFHLPPDFCPSGLNTLTDGFVSCFQHKHVCVSHKGTREESTSFPTNDSIPTSVGMSSSWLSQGTELHHLNTQSAKSSMFSFCQRLTQKLKCNFPF